jgi:ribosomal protein S18 acetylase RimI-like enzyme
VRGTPGSWHAPRREQFALSDFSLRRGTVADAAALAAFAARTFEETFGADNDPADLAAHLAESYGVVQQTRELADPEQRTILIEKDGAIAGYLQLGRREPPSCVTGPAPVEIARFYVDEPFHGQGLAHRLMATARDAAKEMGGRTIWLGVWEHNPRAIAFYGKFGFHDVGTADFFVGPDRQTDRIMLLPEAGSPMEVK